MSLVLDASIAAAWALPDEENDDADAVLLRVGVVGAVAPSLIWHELQNIFLMASRRKRLPEAEIVPSLLRLRRLPIDTVDVSASGDEKLIGLAASYGLTAYDAAYLTLAVDRDLPLATADKALRRACESHRVALV